MEKKYSRVGEEVFEGWRAFKGRRVFEGSSSSLPSPRVIRVQHAQVYRKHDVFSSPRVFRVEHAYNMLKCLQNTTCFRVRVRVLLSYRVRNYPEAGIL